MLVPKDRGWRDWWRLLVGANPTRACSNSDVWNNELKRACYWYAANSATTHGKVFSICPWWVTLRWLTSSFRTYQTQPHFIPGNSVGESHSLVITCLLVYIRQHSMEAYHIHYGGRLVHVQPGPEPNFTYGWIRYCIYSVLDEINCSETFSLTFGLNT